MSVKYFFFVLALSLSGRGLASGVKVDPEFVKQSDIARGFSNQAREYEISFDEYYEGSKVATRIYRVRTLRDMAEAKRTDGSLKEILLINGVKTWSMRGSSQRPAPISLADKTFGLGAVASLMTLFLSQDYSIIKDKIDISKSPVLTADFESSLPLISYSKVHAVFDAKKKTVESLTVAKSQDTETQTMSLNYEKTKKGANTEYFVKSADLVDDKTKATIAKVQFGTPKKIDLKDEYFLITSLVERNK